MSDLPTEWEWLKGTYWYVPEANLLAYSFETDTQEMHAVADQTVFNITGYRGGYFWGRTVVRLGHRPSAYLALTGSVTPEGRVLLTFTPFSTTPYSTPTTGFGQMCIHNGKVAMQNQMSSGSGKSQITHWAYMLQTEPGDESWKSLPGAGVSVPDFMKGCPAGPKG